jgi:hypothetical protein
MGQGRKIRQHQARVGRPQNVPSVSAPRVAPSPAGLLGGAADSLQLIGLPTSRACRQSISTTSASLQRLWLPRLKDVVANGGRRPLFSRPISRTPRASRVWTRASAMRQACGVAIASFAPSRRWPLKAATIRLKSLLYIFELFDPINVTNPS